MRFRGSGSGCRVWGLGFYASNVQGIALETSCPNSLPYRTLLKLRFLLGSPA